LLQSIGRFWYQELRDFPVGKRTGPRGSTFCPPVITT
jgi:hypothetical protein